MNTPFSSKPSAAHQAAIDLITCFIATNGVGLEKGYEIANEILKNNIIVLDTKESLLRCEEKSIFSWLNASSYPRGEYVAGLVAGRIKRSAEQINSVGGVKFLESLHTLGEAEIRASLSPLYGVGEKFIDNYLIISPRA